MKKLFTILIVLFIAMGSNLIFAQVDSSSFENENIEEMEDAESKETSPRFPEGKKPKVAPKVGEGFISKNDVEMESSNDFVENDDSAKSGSKKESKMKENPFEKYNKSVGVFGYAYPGLSWQHWLGNVGYQINFSGMYLPIESTTYDNADKEVIYNYVSSFYMLTAEAQFEFFTTNFLEDWYGRLYGLLVGGFYYKSDYSVPELLNGVAGFGLGFETIYYKHFSFPLHFGYYAEFPNDFKMDFVFGAGLRFRF